MDNEKIQEIADRVELCLDEPEKARKIVADEMSDFLIDNFLEQVIQVKIYRETMAEFQAKLEEAEEKAVDASESSSKAPESVLSVVAVDSVPEAPKDAQEATESLTDPVAT